MVVEVEVFCVVVEKRIRGIWIFRLDLFARVVHVGIMLTNAVVVVVVVVVVAPF